MTTQLAFGFTPRAPVYAYVDVTDGKGQSWCHLVSNAAETAREIEAAMPDVRATVRERRSGR